MTHQKKEMDGHDIRKQNHNEVKAEPWDPHDLCYGTKCTSAYNLIETRHDIE